VNVKQNLYFMALVGALAGLLCWLGQAYLSDYVQTPWILITVVASLMGALVGGLTVGFADNWNAERVMAQWVLMGTLLGAAAGCVAGLVFIPVAGSMTAATASARTIVLGRVVIWLVAGGSIGLVTGLRWAGVNPLRALHAMLGGLVGGAVGALVFAVLGSKEWVQPIAYMMTGLGITLGVQLAPVLLRNGVLQFISSGDARAQNKYGSPQQEWMLQEGDRLVIGSLSAGREGGTMYTRPVDVYIPDAMVSPRHALLFEKTKRFYIELHRENTGPQGQPLSPLELNGQNVAAAKELRDGDDLVIGQTLLRFSSRKKAATPATDERRR
jgi:hypothetical protein